MVNNILEEIEREYRITRQGNEQKAKFYLSKALEVPEFKEVESKLKTIKIDIAKAECFDLDSDKALILKEEQSLLLKKRAEILKKANISEDNLKVTYTCRGCKDTGFINNKPCTCFNEKWNWQFIFLLKIGSIMAQMYNVFSFISISCRGFRA